MPFGVDVNSSGDGYPAQDVAVTDEPTPLSTFIYEGAAATSDVVDARVVGDTVARLVVNADGKMDWGSGAGAADTNLYRTAANILKTDDMLVATVGIGVGNSATANTLGTVTRKIEVFSASGVSIGFLPVYDAITTGG